MKVFVGSSSEIEDKVQSALRYIEKLVAGYNITFDYWRDVFGEPGINGTYTWEVLEKVYQSNEYEASIMFWSGDDTVNIRNKEHPITRDNVILETGAFLFAKGRENVFILLDNDKDMRLATDLVGLSVYRVDYQSNSIQTAMNILVFQKIAEELIRKIKDFAHSTSYNAGPDNIQKKPESHYYGSSIPEYKPRPRDIPDFFS